MKVNLLLAIAIFLSSCEFDKKKTVNNQVAQPAYYSHDSKYSQNFRSLISGFLRYQNDTHRRIVLVQEPIKFEDVGNFLKDSVGFTPVEIRYVKDQTAFLSQINFTKTLSERVVVIPDSTIKTIFGFREKAWDNFHNTYGNYLLRLSNPVFLKNYTLCILYLNYHCGERCGQEQIRLYKKIDGKWVWVKTGYGWIS